MRGHRQRFLRFFMGALAQLLAGSIPLAAGLRSLSLQEENPAARKLLKRLERRILNGSPLSAAMDREHPVFSKLSVGLVLLGERTGALSANLERCAEFQEKDFRLRMKMASALTYPAFLLLATLGGILLLVSVFVPMFLPVYREMEPLLPIPTRLLFIFSQLLSTPLFWIALLGALGGLALGSLFLFRRHRWRLARDRFFLKLPLAGNIIRLGLTAQITWTLATAYRAGLPLIHGLELLEEALENLPYRLLVEHSRLALARGQSLSFYFLQQQDLVPAYVGHMMAVAEKTGTLDRLLLQSTRLLEEEMDLLIHRLASFLEPGILVLLGAAVTSIMVSVFLPLYALLQTAQ